MVKIREEHIDEIKYPHNTKKDDVIYQINCHSNKNDCSQRIINQLHKDDDDIETINIIAII